jgi:2-methylaconitate cis-trans-isomerase PrpF
VREEDIVTISIRCGCGHLHSDIDALHKVGWQATGDGSFGLLVNCSRCGSTIVAHVVADVGHMNDAGRVDIDGVRRFCA